MMLLLFLLAAPECVACHKTQVQSHAGTPMARTLQPAASSRFLADNATLHFTSGAFTYNISRAAYSVSDGAASFTAPLQWAVGHGSTGQTYLFQRDGSWYETAVSYYPAIQSLDWTPGHASRSRRTLDEAIGRQLDSAETHRCFGCHSTPAPGNTFTPGVSCVQCHTGAAAHAASQAPLPKLRTLAADDLARICSQCHPSWEEVAANGPRGVGNVRHQVYRLTGSRCYDTADPRISCAACHNVHATAAPRPASSYDTTCNACHAAGKHCPVAKSDCITCHMPKVEVPGLHASFTDHRIRIARPGAKYPD